MAWPLPATHIFYFVAKSLVGKGQSIVHVDTHTSKKVNGEGGGTPAMLGEERRGAHRKKSSVTHSRHDLSTREERTKMQPKENHWGDRGKNSGNGKSRRTTLIS